MKPVWLALVPALLAPVLTAQDDRITWTDGTVTKNVRVEDFTWREVKYRERGSVETRPSDKVAELEVDAVKEAYRRAFGASTDEDAYNSFLGQARKLAGSKPFLAQFGYHNAALLQMKFDQGQAFAVLEEMVQKLPDSGFYPDLFRLKLGYYLSHGKDKVRSAAKVAKDFGETALQKGWPDGFVHEASYYDIMVHAVDGSVEGSSLLNELKGLLAKTEGAYPAVANKVKVQIADLQRKQGNVEAASKTYEELLDNSGLDEATRAQALLGIGHTYFAQGDPTNTEPYRQALLAFLRVYLETPNASYETKAEALYQAALSSEKWGGADSGLMASRLRGYLRRDFGDSPWAKR